MSKKSLFLILLSIFLLVGSLNVFATPVTDAQGYALSLTASTSWKSGVQILTKNNLNLINVTKNSSVDATTCYLYDVNYNLLQTSTFVGNIANFSYTLASNTKYVIALDKGGVAYSRRYANGVTFPINKTNINYTLDVFNDGETWQNSTSSIRVLESITTEVITPNFTITAINQWNGSSVQSFNATITSDTSQYNFSTTTETITTNISTSDTRLWNITIYSNNYFNNYSNSVNVTTTYQARLYENIINFSLFEFDSNISLSNFSLNVSGFGVVCNTTLHYCFIYPNNGSYNYSLVDNTGQNFYTPINTSLNVSSILLNYSFYSYVTEHWINVSARNILSNASISNFTVNLTDLTDGTDFRNFSTTTGYIMIPVVHHNYSLYIDAYGYALYNNVVNISVNTSIASNSVINYTFYLYTTNSFLISFYDEITFSLLNYTNISFEIISDLFSENYSTSNGTLYIDLLTPETYVFRFKSLPNFDERFYVYALSNRSFINLSLYLVNDSSQITVTIKNQDDDIVSGAIIKVQRYDLNSNSYITREIISTNVLGNAYFQGLLNNEFYKYIVEYPFGTQLLVTEPSYLHDSSFTLRINFDSVSFSDYFASINTYGNIYFNNATNNFNFYYNGISVDEGCLFVYDDDFDNTLLNSSCVSSSSATILIPVTNSSGATFFATGLVTINGVDYIIDSISYTFPSNSLSVEEKKNFLLYTILLTLVLGLLTMWNITWFLIITPLPIFLTSLFGVVPISRPVGITMYLVAITLAVMISKRS